MLSAEQITVTAGTTRLLDDVSVAVTPASVVAIVGPNGAGKSTLLRVLSGEIVPRDGRVLFDDRELATIPVSHQATRRAVMAQSSHLAFPFTAVEVVLMGRAPHVSSSAGAASDAEIVAAAMTVVEIEHLQDRTYPTLSGGEQQRVHLARVLAQIWERGSEPRYLLLDEPTASLDPLHQHRTLQLARRFARDGAGVLAVLHDLNLAAQYADVIVFMRKGRVMATGRPRDVLRAQLIEQCFGVPAIVGPHPVLDCPLVVLGASEESKSDDVHQDPQTEQLNEVQHG